MTTASSSSDSSVQSPASRVPYDVLQEIFIHCLPRLRLREQQPKRTIAPMLLCQICSSWRTAALNSPTLWSHLSYAFPIKKDGSNNSWKTPRDRLRFLSWWRRNQGTMAPSLCIKVMSIRWYEVSVSKHPIPDLELEAVDMISLVQYIASARYLEADEVIWRLVWEWCDKEVYPNPHTLVKSGSTGNEIFYRSQSLMPNHTLPALRFLSLHDNTLPSGDNFVTPHAWSKLTRIAFYDVTISLNAWLSFIRSVPDLEWADFGLILSDHEHDQNFTYTLPRLSELHISHQLGDVNIPVLEFPFSTLLTNLHLPALHTLTLDSFEASWRDHRVISDLCRVFNSTPAITTLILGCGFLSLRRDYCISLAIRNTEPCWRLATHLAHLEFKLAPTWSDHEEEHTRKTVIKNILHPNNHWLDLNNPACTIRKITLIHYGSKRRSRWERLHDFSMSRVREHLKKAPNVNVVFDIQIRDEELTTAGEWNEWGPNF